MQKVKDWTLDHSTRTADIETEHGPTLELNCGRGDGVEIYHDPATRWFYVLTWNHRFPYIGLRAYDLNGEPIEGEQWFYQEWQAQRLVDELPDELRTPSRPDWNTRAAARRLLKKVIDI